MKIYNIVFNIEGLFMKELIDEILKFRNERNWKQFHTPENLAKSISIESAELLEHFQWNNEFGIDDVAEELADIFIYCFYMADTLNLDVNEIILNKLNKNAKKYPVDKSFGVSTKYTGL